MSEHDPEFGVNGNLGPRKLTPTKIYATNALLFVHPVQSYCYTRTLFDNYYFLVVRLKGVIVG